MQGLKIIANALERCADWKLWKTPSGNWILVRTAGEKPVEGERRSLTRAQGARAA